MHTTSPLKGKFSLLSRRLKTTRTMRGRSNSELAPEPRRTTGSASRSVRTFVDVEDNSREGVVDHGIIDHHIFPASSFKLQASSFKLQASSFKLQASSPARPASIHSHFLCSISSAQLPVPLTQSLYSSIIFCNVSCGSFPKSLCMHLQERLFRLA